MKYSLDRTFEELGINNYEEKVSLDIKSTWVISNKENKKYIIKFKSKKNDFFGKLFFLKNNKAFFNELNIYLYLSKNKDIKFNYPTLIKTNYSSFFILDFVEGNKGWIKSMVSNSNMAESLWNFNNTSTNGLSLKVKNPHWLLLKSVKGLLRLFKGKLIDVNTLVMTFKIQYKNNVAQKKINPILLHNDLFGPNNLISCRNKEILFLDFESASFESRWVLKDIIELSFDRRSETFNWDLLVIYKNYLRHNYKHYKDINFSVQIRSILIYRIIQILLSKTEAITYNQKQYCSKFLIEVLINDTVYDKWIETNLLNNESFV